MLLPALGDGRLPGEQGAKVKRNRQLPELSPLGRELGAAILARLASNPLFVSAALPHRYVPPLFNRYEGGEHYGLHVDGSVRSVPGTVRAADLIERLATTGQPVTR